MFLRMILFTLLITGNTTIIMADSQKASNHSHQWATPIDKSIVQNGYKVDNLIYRSAQPDHQSFKKLYDMGIRKTLNLRLFHSDHDEIEKLPIEEIHKPLFLLRLDKNDLIDNVKILAKTKKPILVHCKYGADRTGVVIAAYRILVQHWNADEAIREMNKGGYGYLYIWGDYRSLLKALDTPEVRKEFE